MTSRSERMPPAGAFWENLAADHAAQLSEHGLDVFKRRQALRYFTWRWRADQLTHSEQLRFLLTHARAHDWLEALGRSDLSDEAWHDVDWPVAERYLYSAATRLLWRFAERQPGTSDALGLIEPELGAPFPVQLSGRLISQDLANSALEAAALSHGHVAPRAQHILEIGAGYGRSAYVHLSLNPDTSYTIVDIEPALSISRWYLTTLFGPGRVTFLAPADLAALEPRSFDLTLSISSLSELSPPLIGWYLNQIGRVTRGGLVYLKQWTTWWNPVDRVRVRFQDYPIPVGWQRLVTGPCPVQTSFTQALWQVPG